jgi:hypothetical protein
MGLIIAAVVGTGTLGALTDWLFMGVLFHDAYNRYPEIWRPGVREGASRAAIVLSSALGYLISAAVVGLCLMAGVRSVIQGLEVAAVSWAAGPAVVIIVNGLFIKMDARIVVSHCLGYLARALIAGAGAGLVLGLR